jgi:hypothetical protein
MADENYSRAGRARVGHACLIVSLVINCAIVVFELIAAVMSFGRNGAGMLAFYTEDSNLFALLTCSAYAVCAVRSLRSGRAVFPAAVTMLKYMSVCCLTVTFIVVVCVLCPMYGAEAYRFMLLENSMLFHHLICPVAAALSFIFFEPCPASGRRTALIALIPTAAYAAVTVTLNIARVMKGPYPFLHVYEQPVYMSVIWLAVILAGAYLIARLIALAGSAASRARGPRAE